MLDLERKTAIVTGSGRGIGAAIALEIARAGANVVVTYLNNHERAKATVAKITDFGGSAIISQSDGRNPKCAEDMCKLATETFGSIDILVNNSHTPFTPFSIEELEWDCVWEQLEGSVKAPFNCIKSALPHLIESKSGVVLNISSSTVRTLDSGFGHRNLAKAALENYSCTLASELARYGIRVNTLSVGWTQTDQLNCLNDSYVDLKVNEIPLKRIATVEEIANAALFLVSSNSSYITGSIIPVSGGI